MNRLQVGIIPYSPGMNPYQRLVANSIRSAGVEVVECPGPRLFPITRALLHRMDVLHMHWPHSFYTGRTAFLTKVKRVMYAIGRWQLRRHPFVYSAENLIAHDSKDLADEVRMIQLLIDCCDGIVTMSGRAQDLLRATYRVPADCEVIVVPHGHYIDQYPNTISAKDARQRLGIGLEARVVLALGRIRKYKGLDLLAEAFTSVCSRGHVLLIAGSGGDAELIAVLQRWADKAAQKGGEIRVVPKVVPDDELQVFFNASDVVALPYQDEPMNPGGLVLAMSFGRCVVAPMRGTIPERVSPGGCFGYTENSAGGIQQALQEALRQDDLFERGQAAKAHAKEYFDWVKIGQQFRGLYERILGAGR